MREYGDHLDDEGYRANFTSDEEAALVEFATWLEAHSIGYTHDVVAAPEEEEGTIWTEWITDKGKAALLKLTWGGR